MINNKNKGYILIDIILAISIFSLLSVSVFSLTRSLHLLPDLYKERVIYAKSVLDNPDNLNHIDKQVTNEIDKKIYYDSFADGFEKSIFNKIEIESAQSTIGQDICTFSVDYKNKPSIINIETDFGAYNFPTNIKADSNFLYISTDGNIENMDDLFILEKDKYAVVGSVNVGAGISDFVVVKDKIYTSITSSKYQLGVIDIKDKSDPKLISSLKLIAENSSISLVLGKSIYYRDGYIFLGTNKWEGGELSIIDTISSSTPLYVSSFEIDALVDDIFVDTDLHFLYLATSGESHLRIVDISNIYNPHIVQELYFGGEKRSEGKVISSLGNYFIFGRTTGGFNNKKDPELIILSREEDGLLIEREKMDYPGGIYDVFINDKHSFYFSGDIQKTLEIKYKEKDGYTDFYPLLSRALNANCFLDEIYIVLEDYPYIKIMER